METTQPEGTPMPDEPPAQPLLRAAVPHAGADTWWGVPRQHQPTETDGQSRMSTHLTTRRSGYARTAPPRRWGPLFVLQSIVVAVYMMLGSAGYASADPSTPGFSQLHDVSPDSVEGQSLLKVAATDADAQLGKSAGFAVQKFKASNGWAFLSAQLRSPDGSPFDFAGTPLAEAAANGGASKRYVALFRAGGSGGWDVVTSAVGPTAPVWSEWAQQYSAPAELFGN